MNQLVASRLKENHRAVQGHVQDLYLDLDLHLGQKHAPYQGRVVPCSCSFFPPLKRVLSPLVCIGRQMTNDWTEFIVGHSYVL